MSPPPPSGLPLLRSRPTCLRNILANLPERPDLHARVRAAYWAALDGVNSPEETDAGLPALVRDPGRDR